jgi:Bax protein
MLSRTPPPLIEQENERLLETRAELTGLFAVLDNGRTLDPVQHKRVQTLATAYRVDGHPETVNQAREALLRKIDTVPLSMALAQAANDSAWGRSRLLLEGNNLFGIWTHDESRGIVPRKRAPGKKHLVRRFDLAAYDAGSADKA